MTIQTITIVADVPDDQTTAAQAAAATFVDQLPENADGAVIISATFGGTSLIPTPLEALQAATAQLVALATRTSPRPSAADLDAAAAKVDAATRALELTEAAGGAPATAPAPTGTPATPTDAPPAVNADTVAATAPAPTGEPTAEAPAADDAQPVAGLPDVPPSA